MTSMYKVSTIGRRKFLVGGATALAAASSLNAINVRANESSVRIVIVGSGAAGISLANRLSRALKNAKIIIVDRKETHYYWPGLTLVATGAWPKSKVLDRNSRFLPSQVDWVKEMVINFNPEVNRVETDTGRQIEYDYLIVASGVEYNYRSIEGLDIEAFGQNGLASVYHSPDVAALSWNAIKQYSQTGGDAIFTLPSTPVRCAGVPLQMAFLTIDRLKQNGGFGQANLNFYSANQNVFGLPWFNQFILDRFKEDGMQVGLETELSAVDIGARKASFKKADGQIFTQDYDLLHVVPPMRAPSSVRYSDLAWQEGNMRGWLAVDKDTLQHVKYSNVFGCGDVNGTSRGKTAATVKMSVPIVVENLLAVIANEEPTASFNGYTSCPLLTKFGAAMLIEFDYNGTLVSTFPFIDPYKESWLGWVMKEQLLKPTYLQMLKGNV
ncbi:MAG: NAD(P)/FAD-dependent oxidoreductase [Thiomicrospira sp.]|uniref:NAD(P)/FAD-dependent oxidoreductase n=1 Tax=Thiomicrospira sp. TaxID=935 RepID=UPI001A09CE77|nr:FAD/NAD(P)-binding oxidoreductase [Thiomicrospira sp.]MBE0493815.1 NAD(P)/FAD-dependent oxidoreductase [Thiomicrospira sp.]